MKNSLLEGTDQSESICDYVEWALSKNFWKKDKLVFENDDSRLLFS